MLIRPAEISDARRIAEIHADAWRAAYRGILPDSVLGELDVDRRTQVWATRIAGKKESVLVADSRHVVGWATFGQCHDADGIGAGEVSEIYIDPAVFRQGIGRQLWNAVMADLAASGFDSAAVWVLSANEPARRFYEAVGGQIDEPSESHYIRKGRKLGYKIRYWCPVRDAAR